MDISEAKSPDDLERVRELFVEYAAGVEVDLCFQGFANELAGLPGKYAPPDGGLWIATEGETVAACVALRRLDAERAEMKRLFVRPAFRGSGRGRTLVEWVLAEAIRLGYHRVVLDTLPSMAGAIRLYRSLGFIEIPAYCHNPVPGALYLERELAIQSTASAKTV